MNPVRGLGRPLWIRESVIGICLFELGFGLSIFLYMWLEAHATTVAVDLDAEVFGWFYFGLWIIVAVSIIPAGIGFVAAESLMRPRGWRERAWIGTLAGLGYGLGWLIPIVIGSLATNLDIVGVALFWIYMVTAPILWFVVLARLSAMIRHGQRAPAA